ncbi:hypothetical protein ACXPWS_31270 [Mycobacterium sp. BMJ-28]
MSTPLPSDIRDDAPATLGLLLNFAALLAITGSLAMALSGQTATAVVLAIAAAAGFVASLVYFAVDSHRADQSAD